MLISAFMPWIEAVGLIGVSILLRVYDGGLFYWKTSPKNFKTKKTTLLQFIDLYAGPVY